jgi:hypothetical protein
MDKLVEDLWNTAARMAEQRRPGVSRLMIAASDRIMELEAKLNKFNNKPATIAPAAPLHPLHHAQPVTSLSYTATHADAAFAARLAAMLDQ